MCPFSLDLECQACFITDLRQVFNRVGYVSMCRRYPLGCSLPFLEKGDRSLADCMAAGRSKTFKLKNQRPFDSLPSTSTRQERFPPPLSFAGMCSFTGGEENELCPPGERRGGGHHPHVPLRRAQRGWSGVSLPERSGIGTFVFIHSVFKQNCS